MDKKSEYSLLAFLLMLHFYIIVIFHTLTIENNHHQLVIQIF